MKNVKLKVKNTSLFHFLAGVKSDFCAVGATRTQSTHPAFHPVSQEGEAQKLQAARRPSGPRWAGGGGQSVSPNARSQQRQLRESVPSPGQDAAMAPSTKAGVCGAGDDVGGPDMAPRPRV